MVKCEIKLEEVLGKLAKRANLTRDGILSDDEVYEIFGEVEADAALEAMYESGYWGSTADGEGYYYYPFGKPHETPNWSK